MKKILFVFAAMIALAACGNKQAAAPGVPHPTEDSLAQGAKDYYAAVDRYLTEQIARHYAPGEYTVPLSDVVAVNEEDTTDIRLWGDFWVYNYKQVGDTLKCVSGGSHPGLIHICKKDENFYVTRFDQVEDGSRYLPSAKQIFGEYFESFQLHHSDADNREMERAETLRLFVRDHNLTATMYQDYGWPAKELR